MASHPAPIPLVLVHGWAGSFRAWDPVVELVDPSRWHPILPVRLPGSPGAAPGRDATIGDAVDAVVEALDGLGAPAMLVGHSMGGQVVLRVATERHDAVVGEVVIDPAYGADPAVAPEMRAWAERVERDGHVAVDPFFAAASAVPSVQARVEADLLATPADVIARYLRSEYVDPDAVGLFPQTLVVAGRRRRPVLALHSRREGVAAEEALPRPAGSRIVRWHGHGHFLHLEAPERFVALLDGWRRELSGDADGGGLAPADPAIVIR